MNRPTLKFSDNRLELDGRVHELDYPISDAKVVDDTVVVLFDPDEGVKRPGQFRNLIGLSFNGELKWIAELPTTSSADCYFEIVRTRPLIVYSFVSYECQIDPKNGKILRTRFLK